MEQNRIMCFFLFSSYDMFLLDFNNYPRIFFARVGCLFLNERSVSFYQSVLYHLIFSVLGGRVFFKCLLIEK